jgi:hypothetical protein
VLLSWPFNCTLLSLNHCGTQADTTVKGTSKNRVFQNLGSVQMETDIGNHLASGKLSRASVGATSAYNVGVTFIAVNKVGPNGLSGEAFI